LAKETLVVPASGLPFASDIHATRQVEATRSTILDVSVEREPGLWSLSSDGGLAHKLGCLAILGRLLERSSRRAESRIEQQPHEAKRKPYDHEKTTAHRILWMLEPNGKGLGAKGPPVPEECVESCRPFVPCNRY
jgi:hypothetical protein